MLSSPSVRTQHHETEYAITRADLRGIAECAVAAHNATMRNMEFDDVCVEQNGIVSDFICLNKSKIVTDCAAKPAFSYIVTATYPIPNEQYNDMMDLLDKYYSDAGTFGIFSENAITSGGTASRRIVPRGIISNLNLTGGELVYMTQYEIPDAEQDYTSPESANVLCPGGTVKTYRFGRWQCIPNNAKVVCGGDMIWDSLTARCIPDESRKPLCATKQTAIIVDDVWQCVDPFPDKNCPANMTARLNYNTMEWECVTDPDAISDTTKCAAATTGVVYGPRGATLRVSNATSCTDCEKMVVDSETCAAACVPDITKINSHKCYPGPVAECSGSSRAFYFGFPNSAYVANIPDLSNVAVPFDSQHSQNRRFNCLDCGSGYIDTDKSVSPYVAICK